MKRSGPIPRKTPMKRTRMATDRRPGKAPNPPRRHRAAKQKGLRRPTMDGDLRASIYARADGMCDRCGVGMAPDAWECHHRQLRSRGGGDSHENLVALCTGCHVWAHGNPAEATSRGWIVPSWAGPEQIPVHRHGRAWALPVGTSWRPVRLWSEAAYEGANE